MQRIGIYHVSWTNSFRNVKVERDLRAYAWLGYRCLQGIKVFTDLNEYLFVYQELDTNGIAFLRRNSFTRISLSPFS